jgi:hypothetical protein
MGAAVGMNDPDLQEFRDALVGKTIIDVAIGRREDEVNVLYVKTGVDEWYEIEGHVTWGEDPYLSIGPGGG